MKKILFFVILSLSQLTYANSHFFVFDEMALDSEFAELSNLEELVLAQSDMDFLLVQSVDCLPQGYQSASAEGFQGSEFSFQWEGFLWGFLCCPVGFFVVAVNKNKTKDNKTSFWIGVLGYTVLSALQSIAVASTAY